MAPCDRLIGETAFDSVSSGLGTVEQLVLALPV